MKIVAITPDRKYDGIASCVIEGLLEKGVKIIASDPGNGIEKGHTDREILNHAKSADYIFSFWGKVRGNNPPRHYLLDQISRKEVSVYIDGSEWTCTGYNDDQEKVYAPWSKKSVNRQVYDAKFNPQRLQGSPWINFDMLQRCNWYFKRECYRDDLELGIVPLPFSGKKEYIIEENAVKDIDVFCSFGQNMTGLRSEVEDYCRQISNKNVIVLESPVSKKEYENYISRSKIVVSAWGGGQHCFREWESLGARACTFVQRHTVEFPDKPVDGYHWVEYSNMQEFDQKMKFYLNNAEDCVRIAENGFNFLSSKHMPVNRVEYILNIIQGEL